MNKKENEIIIKFFQASEAEVEQLTPREITEIKNSFTYNMFVFQEAVYDLLFEIVYVIGIVYLLKDILGIEMKSQYESRYEKRGEGGNV